MSYVVISMPGSVSLRNYGTRLWPHLALYLNPRGRPAAEDSSIKSEADNIENGSKRVTPQDMPREAAAQFSARIARKLLNRSRFTSIKIIVKSLIP
ncbi:MAG TPA: hypothetical protein VFS91_12360 [Nitrobacter sp.]|nr:hypothetical protein [Nitrobacter sp.]